MHDGILLGRLWPALFVTPQVPLGFSWRPRVKCDERYPVCLRCEQRNTICRATPRIMKWQVEMPSLRSSSNPDSILNQLSAVNKRLLQYWFEKTSQIMVIDPSKNPMSYPITQHLTFSSSVLHAVLSISSLLEAILSIGSGYATYFEPQQIALALTERHLALSTLQTELRASSCPSISSLITVILLG